MARKPSLTRRAPGLTEQKANTKGLAGRQAQCSKDNAELYQVGQDLLARYEDKGLAEVLYAKEPVVQLGRVKRENLAAQYRERLDAGEPSPEPASLAATMRARGTHVQITHMAIKFKSQATGDLVMVQATAQAVLQLLGKSADGPGIIEPADMPSGLAHLACGV